LADEQIESPAAVVPAIQGLKFKKIKASLPLLLEQRRFNLPALLF
jgi:hypothetical protein